MLNRVTINGRLTKDVELRITTNGTEVATINIAVQRDFKNGDKADTDFFNVVAYKQNAKYLSTYAKKGTLLSVDGKLQNRSWEKDGNKRIVTEIIAESVYVLSKQEKTEIAEDNSMDISEDKLPF